MAAPDHAASSSDHRHEQTGNVLLTESLVSSDLHREEEEEKEEVGDDGDSGESWRIRASELRLERPVNVVHPPPLSHLHEHQQLYNSTSHSRESSLSYCCNGAIVDQCLKALGRRTGLDKYYHEQREILKEFNDLDALVEMNTGEEERLQAKEERDALAKKENFAILISNYANMFLFAMKVFVSVKSGSLAIIASTLDSLLDLLSGFILWFTAHTIKRPNPYVYPIGKNRMQPVGILVFASVMATLGLQILLESARTLIAKDSTINLSGDKKIWIISVMVSVTIIKFFLMILCRLYKNEIVRAYAKDHFFDVVTNTLGLVAALLAARFAWWIDPSGAIVLALYTIYNWSVTVLENVKTLVGETAPPEFLQKLTYLSWNHHRDVKQIDTVRAYTFGGYYFVEVDIVLEEKMPLRQAHDIGESLQDKLERLPEVERAFVHLDFEVSHRPEHARHI